MAEFFKLRLQLEARPYASRTWGYLSPVLALLITVVIGVLLFVRSAKTRCEGCRCFSGSRFAAPMRWAS